MRGGTRRRLWPQKENFRSSNAAPTSVATTGGEEKASVFPYKTAGVFYQISSGVLMWWDGWRKSGVLQEVFSFRCNVTSQDQTQPEVQRGWRTFPMEKGWGKWGCAAWGRFCGDYG